MRNEIEALKIGIAPKLGHDNKMDAKQRELELLKLDLEIELTRLSIKDAKGTEKKISPSYKTSDSKGF